MDNTLKLLKKIIFISNVDTNSKGFNRIILYGFLSGLSELIIFASSISIIKAVTEERELIFNPFLLLFFVAIGSSLRIFSSKNIINLSHIIGSRLGKNILKKRLSSNKLYNYSKNIDDNIVVSIVNYTQIFVSSLQNISLAIAALFGIGSIIFILSIFYYINSIFIIIFIGILYILINKLNSYKLSKISREIAINQRSTLTNTREPLNMDEEIYVNNSSDFYEKKLFDKQSNLMKNLANSSFISSLPKLIIEFFILSFICIFLIIDIQSTNTMSYINDIIILIS